MATLWNDSLKDINYVCIHKIEFATWWGNNKDNDLRAHFFKCFTKFYGDKQKLTNIKVSSATKYVESKVCNKVCRIKLEFLIFKIIVVSGIMVHSLNYSMYGLLQH